LNLLLDTHAFVWWRARDPRLGEVARAMIAAADRIIVSAASAWEAAIKISQGKLKLPEPFDVAAEASGVERIPVTFEHAKGVIGLPWHHRDPFDRVLIATARAEGLGIVTADAIFARYDVPVVPT
jgi:PIN domain nuclease of toxin-antitoxin system